MDINRLRIAALDYGLSRIGMAVCDEFHITVNTRPVINNDSTLWDVLLTQLDKDRIDVVVVGVPRKLDDSQTPIIEAILAFIEQLRQRTTRQVVESDESFSTSRAREIMHATGMKKKRREKKGTKDAFAAAVILRDFLEEHRL